MNNLKNPFYGEVAFASDTAVAAGVAAHVAARVAAHVVVVVDELAVAVCLIWLLTFHLMWLLWLIALEMVARYVQFQNLITIQP